MAETAKPHMEMITGAAPLAADSINEGECAVFRRITSVALTPQQRESITVPAATYPRQRNVLGIHWHPEYIPMDLTMRRVAALFPSMENTLIIPTQHNEIMSHETYSGVEVDCYSSGFNQKVQLLLHFRNEDLTEAHTLNAMLQHTFKYRSSQLFDIIHTLVKPDARRLNLAARRTGAGRDVVEFVRAHVKKVETLLAWHAADTPSIMIKNKLLRNFLDGLRPDFGDALIDRAQTFLQAVKEIVKSEFPFKYFYRTSEIIEEARAHRAGIVIPHPEQFWPILLADYDVDGCEVWNPQSRRYTEFLISILDKKNRLAGLSKRKQIVFMGDDTHMGEKILPPNEQTREKAEREVGLQPAWDDPNIRKALIAAGWNRETTIREYAQRIGG